MGRHELTTMGMAVDDDAVTSAIAALIRVDDDRVTMSTHLTDLVTDSFVLVQLAVELQDEFDVVFHAEDLDRVQVVGDLVDLVRSRASW
jgi:acyl carrier protein